jgi:alkylation response protein AidB-like acyl-CoA dehydrogenase
MNYEHSDAHKELQSAMAAFCKAEISPGAARLDVAPRDESVSKMRSNLKKLAETGCLKLFLEDDLTGRCVAGEELAHACPATFMTAISSATLYGRAVQRFGTEAQQRKNLLGIDTGDAVGAFACTEVEAGSDMEGMTTTAVKRDGSWVLNGEKDLVTNAPLADRFLILAWIDRHAGIEKGTALFLIRRSTKGLTVGEPLETMGLRGALTAGINLSECAVDTEAILGSEAGRGYSQMLSILEEIKLAMATLSVGIGMACMEESTRHAKTKKCFGKPIGLFEGVGAKLAIMYSLNDIGRMMTCRAAWAMEQDDPESAVLASCAKLFTSEAVGKIADLAMQVHGGHGYLKGAAVERLYRDARFAQIAYGTSERQRAFIAADSLNRFTAA